LKATGFREEERERPGRERERACGRGEMECPTLGCWISFLFIYFLKI
jgi:hypothetical protein